MFVNEPRRVAIPLASAEVRVRTAAPSDAARIAAILSDSFAEFQTLYTPEGYAATTPTAEQVWQRLAEGPTWVVAHQDGIVGTVSAIQRRDNSLYVRGMAVVPPVRGLQIGDALLNTVHRFAIENGCSRLLLSTTPFLSAAIRLYERFGFQRTADGPHDLFGTPLFTMSKELSGGNHLCSYL